MSKSKRPLYGEDAAALRKKAGFTQVELAQRWGLSRSQIGRYERVGEIVPQRIADAYYGLAFGQQNA
ncbi:helix-turn-helix transcriptional regulator [Ralstonia pickettii]|jgi:transcriptional regulator with XRE-family HTH domain|uniref:helix-turn-helix domain-containing protein n=1 Tax=Ralstonia TaxID=48736 RepID=UPI00203A6807|nr:helix-turn-helix transcriptional regulator [Ralstonia pickettii]MCL6483894.1 helix-turn-helix transcriptional regulator [Janthinobacterium lividum]MCM3583703.1 helix-turn-helix transcriptional regulator [Ralstonia pickettii]